MSYDDIVRRAATRLVRQAAQHVDAPGRLERLHRARRRERVFFFTGVPAVAILVIGISLLLFRGGDPSFTDTPTTTSPTPATTAPTPTTERPSSSTTLAATSTTSAPQLACPGPAPLPQWALGSTPLEGLHGSVVTLVDAMNRLPTVVATQTDFTGEWIEKPPSETVVLEAFAALWAVSDHAVSLVGDPEFVRLWPQRTVWLSDLYTVVNGNLPHDFLGELTDLHGREEVLAYLSEEGRNPSRCEVVAAIVSRTDIVLAGGLEQGGPSAETGPSTDLPPFVLASSWTPDLGDAVVADLAVSEGWLWGATTSSSTVGVLRIDPSTGDIDATIELYSLYIDYVNIEVGEGAVWAAHGGRLSRIDQGSAEVVASADVGFWNEYGTRPLAVGEGAVWLATETGVGRFDPGDLRLFQEIEVGAAPSGIALGSDSLWVLVGQRVLQVDLTTFEIVARVTVPGSIFYPSIGTPLAYGNGAVWIGAGGLARLDPATNDVETVYAVSRDECCGPTAIGFAGGRVIVSGLGESELSSFDPVTNTLERIAVTRCAVFSIAGTDDGFWVAVARCGSTVQRYDLDGE